MDRPAIPAPIPPSPVVPGAALVAEPSAAPVVQGVIVSVLLAVTVSHFLNDLMQSVLVGVYPLLRDDFRLSYADIGLLTLANQVTASLLQPVVGWYTDRRPQRFALSVGMGFTFIGVLLLATAGSFAVLLAAAALVGVGSSVFHPEASRIARLSSGGRFGLAQSVFQVGGNAGSALGPMLAALVIAPRGQGSIAWFSLAALLAMSVLGAVGVWYGRHQPRRAAVGAAAPAPLTRPVVLALLVLVVLVFSKYVYLASLTNYYTFYLMAHFHLTRNAAQLQLTVFLAAVAAGTLLGGPIGDRLGRKRVIWASILGIAPLTITLPYLDLLGTEVLAGIIGFILASAFSAILVFAQELVPGRVGMISGLFFGLAFGVAGLGAAALGEVADQWGLDTVYRILFVPAAARHRHDVPAGHAGAAGLMAATVEPARAHGMACDAAARASCRSALTVVGRRHAAKCLR